MRYNVLVITTDANLVNQIMAHVGGQCNIKDVKTRKAALQCALREEPVMCVVDDNVPDLNGYELCGTVKTEYRKEHIGFLLLGKNISQFDDRKARLVGVDAFFVKPIERKRFIGKLQEFQDRYEMLRKSANIGGNALNANGPNMIEINLDDFGNDDKSPFVSTSVQFSQSLQEDSVVSEGDNESDGTIYHGLGEPNDEESSEISHLTSLKPETGLDSSNDPVQGLKTNKDDKIESISISVAKDLAQSKNNVLDQQDITRIIYEIIGEKTEFLTEERIEKIVIETVAKRLTIALSALSPRILKAVRTAVEREVQKHLEPEVKQAMD